MSRAAALACLAALLLLRLSALELSDGAWEPGSFHVIASLPRLRRLSLGPTSHLPACLPKLSGLSELVLREAGKAMLAEAACAAVDAALQQLTQLTSLCIDDAPDRCGPFAALAALNRLQRCCLGNAERGFRPQQDPPLQLPTGPWAGSLRSLGAGWDVLPHSSQLLSTATQLTQLAVTGGSLDEYSPEFWRWAETHRSLQRLQIDVWGSLPAWMVQCMLALKDAQPGLVVQVAEAFDDGMFSEQWRVWV